MISGLIMCILWMAGELNPRGAGSYSVRVTSLEDKETGGAELQGHTNSPQVTLG